MNDGYCCIDKEGASEDVGAVWCCPDCGTRWEVLGHLDGRALWATATMSEEMKAEFSALLKGARS